MGWSVNCKISQMNRHDGETSQSSYPTPNEYGVIQYIDFSSDKRPGIAIQRKNEHGYVKTRQREQSNQSNLSILKEKISALEREVKKYFSKSDEIDLNHYLSAYYYRSLSGFPVQVDFGQFKGLMFEKAKTLINVDGSWNRKIPVFPWKRFRTTSETSAAKIIRTCLCIMTYHRRFISRAAFQRKNYKYNLQAMA